MGSEMCIRDRTTSHTTARQRNDRGIAQHIASSDSIAPTTVAASVVASTAAWAEAWTKYAILHDVTMIESLGLAAMTVDGNGSIAETTTWKEFVR